MHMVHVYPIYIDVYYGHSDYEIIAMFWPPGIWLYLNSWNHFPLFVFAEMLGGGRCHIQFSYSSGCSSGKCMIIEFRNFRGGRGQTMPVHTCEPSTI